MRILKIGGIVLAIAIMGVCTAAIRSEFQPVQRTIEVVRVTTDVEGTNCAAGCTFSHLIVATDDRVYTAEGNSWAAYKPCHRYAVWLASDAGRPTTDIQDDPPPRDLGAWC